MVAVFSPTAVALEYQLTHIKTSNIINSMETSSFTKCILHCNRLKSYASLQDNTCSCYLAQNDNEVSMSDDTVHVYSRVNPCGESKKKFVVACGNKEGSRKSYFLKYDGTRVKNYVAPGERSLSSLFCQKYIPCPDFMLTFEDDEMNFTDKGIFYNNVPNSRWILHSGGTYSKYTGPENDHTLNSRGGWYIYYEASIGHTLPSGKITYTIEDDWITIRDQAPFQGGKCLTFWLHMYQTFNSSKLLVGSLTVIQLNKVPKRNLTLVHIDGNLKYNTWMQQKMDLHPTNDPYDIQFHATRKEYMGDKAIDDIMIFPTSCKDIDLQNTSLRIPDGKKFIEDD